MAGASDKARYYLEQTVPELREWERRELFSSDEISSVAAKRSDFEHVLNARESQSSDYARYAAYEMNLDSLRRMREKRRGVKASGYTCQRRIFFILDRGTRKFHGDIALWRTYIEYARKQKSHKRLARILTDVLRMHPTKPELWIYAAKYAMDVQADAEAARNFMQRGLRFCKSAKSMYLEYARLEMGYIAKIAERRRILGLDSTIHDLGSPEADAIESKVSAEEAHADVISLENQIKAFGHRAVDDSVMHGLPSTPAMLGAVPIAIFDVAMQQFSHEPTFAEEFFRMFAAFDQVSCVKAVCQHVLDDLQSSSSISCPSTLSCDCQMPLIGVTMTSPQFPAALRVALNKIKSVTSSMSLGNAQLIEHLVPWLSTLSENHALHSDLKNVVLLTVRHLSQLRDALAAPT